MFKSINKLSGKFLLLLLMMVMGLAYTQIPGTLEDNRDLLRAANLFNGVDVDDIESVSFVSPSTTAIPVNNVVTITSVYVEFGTDPADNTTISGSDLIDSGVSFDSSVALPAGVTIVGNKIYTPSTFATFTIDEIHIAGSTGSPFTPAQPLTITAATCSAIDAHLIRAYGDGLDFPTGGLPTPSVSTTIPVTDPFDFVSQAVTSVVLSYPVAPAPGGNDVPYGAKTFTITTNLVANLEQRAKISYSNGNGSYEINVRDEGQTVATAGNFAYVFNDLLGLDSPFIASLQAGGNVSLATRELGDHTLDYQCLVNDVAVANCFLGGTDGATDILTTPLALDNIVAQGSTTLVYAGDSVGITSWSSSNSAIFDISTLTQAQQQQLSTVSFASELLTSGPSYNVSQASYNLTNCSEEPTNGDPITERTCDVVVNIPIEYDISANNYTSNVVIGTDLIDVTVKGSKLIGNLTGTGRWNHGVGMSIDLSGKVQGVVSGDASGNATGKVTGTVSSNVSASVSVSSANLLTITEVIAALGAGGKLDGTPSSVNAGFIAESAGTFTSTVQLNSSSEVTNFAFLNAKRPGTAILTVKDDQGCIAALDVVVDAQKIMLDMVGREPSEVFEEGDSVPIKAFIGAQHGQVEEMQEITSTTGIEWFSSNSEVAKVDATGLVTVLAPGKTNITARYDTGVAEIGTIESDPMTINVDKIVGLTISLDENSRTLLPTDYVNNGKKTITLVINNPEAVGNTLVVEGGTLANSNVVVTLPVATYANDIARVTAIATQLETDLEAIQNNGSAIFQAQVSSQFPGVLIIEPVNQSDINTNGAIDLYENGRVDIVSSVNTDDLTMLPHFGHTLNLPAAVTYGLLVIAEYESGKTRRLTPQEVEWINTPLNYLDDAALESGLLSIGEIVGTSTVKATFTNADESSVSSNSLVVVVDAGPAIDYLRRIGFGDILKGGRIRLQTKVTDVDTIADIQDIYVSIVKSAYSTYNEILADGDAVWFTATPFKEEITIEQQGTDEATNPADALRYRIYDIPVEIPIDGGLFNGTYKLVLSISDKNNHTANKVLPIYIGKAASGDVNGDGLVNLIDVVLAFKIATGTLPNATTAQMAAANMDGQGSVTMIDVILLFRKVASL